MKQTDFFHLYLHNSVFIIERKLVKNISFVGNNRFLPFTTMANHFRMNFFFLQVCVSKEGTVAEYGMLATEDIDEGEVLFTIPRSALLHPGTSEVSALLEKGDNSLFACFFWHHPRLHFCLILSKPSTEKSSLESLSGWVPLLLALLHEYTSPQSQWKAYLSLWTDFKSLDHPMFW